MMILGRYVPFVGPWIAGLLANLLAARLSRSDEYEADEYAAALLAKSGIGLAPQKSLFLKLEALTQSRAGMAPAWLMSHPKTAERIAALDRLEAGWKSS
jgi:putative metalloprotease